MELSPRSPHFFRVVHLTGRWPLIGHSAHAQNHLHMLTEPKSEVEILNGLKLPLDLQRNGRFATDLKGQIPTVIQGQGRFTKFRLPRVILPVV